MAKKRSDGRFQKKFTYEGKQYFVYADTRQELEEKTAAKRQALKDGMIDRENPRLNDFYAKWKATRVNVKDATLRKQQFQYNACAAIWIDTANRTLGEMRLADIRPDDIRQVQAGLSQPYKENGKKTKKIRHAKTINDDIAHLSQVFNAAIDEDLISKNPCRPVKNIRVTETPARETIHRALTLEEEELFFEEAEYSFYYDVYRFAINTGMRCGEIGALYNTDIKDGMIHVCRTITKTDKGYEIGDDLKTEAGKRDIILTDELKKILAHQREINRIMDNKPEELGDRIFKAVQRGLLLDEPCNREIKRICERTGIEPFTMHCFRDTYATRLIEAGVNPKTIQELLGHTHYGFTMDRYGHVLTDTKKAEMLKFEEYKSKRKKHKSEGDNISEAKAL